MCDTFEVPGIHGLPWSIPQALSSKQTSPPSPKKKSRRRGPRLTGVSKQRRMANARERRRVDILNKNIESLRHLIPIPPQSKEPSRTEVIWLAADYIAELTKMLETADSLDALVTRSDLFNWDSLTDIDDNQILCIDAQSSSADSKRSSADSKRSSTKMERICANGVVLQQKKKSKRRGLRLTGLSRQRRQANARERSRVQTLNTNIQELRDLIPLPPQEKEPSKSEVIWLAASYIARLTEMLKEDEEYCSSCDGGSPPLSPEV